MTSQKSVEQQFISELEKLVDSMLHLSDLWSELSHKAFEITSEEFPINKSFDEFALEMLGWRNHLKERFKEEGLLEKTE